MQRGRVSPFSAISPACLSADDASSALDTTNPEKTGIRVGRVSKKSPRDASPRIRQCRSRRDDRARLNELARPVVRNGLGQRKCRERADRRIKAKRERKKVEKETNTPTPNSQTSQKANASERNRHAGKNGRVTSRRYCPNRCHQRRLPAQSMLVPQSASRTTTRPVEQTKEHGE